MSKKKQYTVTSVDEYGPDTSDTDDFAQALLWVTDAILSGDKVTLKSRAVK